jgi:hypothetical protein
MTAVQALLDFEQKAEPSLMTLNGMVYKLLKDSGDWWTPQELCRAILNRHDLMISDSSATARLRDLRKPSYGAHNIVKRKREGSRAYEYRLEDWHA